MIEGRIAVATRSRELTVLSTGNENHSHTGFGQEGLGGEIPFALPRQAGKAFKGAIIG